MDVLMAAAAVLGLGPALALMYIVLRKYTYPAVESPFFSDPRFFGLFVIGLIAGTVTFVIYTFFQWGSLFVAVAFALILELIKLVVLNLRRFHGQSDTIFYGYGLGLGVGCTMAFGLIFYVSSGGSDLGSWVILIMMGMTYILYQSSAGTTIGEGIARKRPWEFFLSALLIGLIVQMLFLPLFLSDVGLALKYLSLTAALAVAAVFFYRTHFIKLPAIVREILRNEARRPNSERSD